MHHIHVLLVRCSTLLVTRERPDRGASLVEYALLLSLIAIVCVAAVSVAGRATASRFSSINNSW